MSCFAYDGFLHPVRALLSDTHRAVWEQISAPGTWCTGAERVAIAAEVRAARQLRADPPWLRGHPSWLRSDPSGLRGDPSGLRGHPSGLRNEAAPHEGPLSEAALEAARRVAIDAHRIERVWAERIIAALGDAPYVELVSVAVCVTAIDAFAEAMGVAVAPLPEPKPGAPSRVRPDGMGEGVAWVPMTEPWVGPNVARALSLVPGGQHSFMSLTAAMYAFGDFAELVWERPLTRPQIELVAARVSSVNECFY